MNKKTSFFTWLNNHPILSSIIGIMIVFFIFLVIIPLKFFNIWTNHGKTTLVPEVIGLPFEQGKKMLEDADFEVIVTDSVFRKGAQPGSIVEVTPTPNSVVKRGREVYVTTMRFSPEYIRIEKGDILNYHLNELKAYFKAKGILFLIKEVPSDYDEKVIDIKYNGKSLQLYDKINVGDQVIIEVGRRQQQVTTDTVPEIDIEELLRTYESELTD